MKTVKIPEDLEERIKLPRTREVAQALGSRHYFTCEPCDQDHLDMRRTETGECVECRSERKSYLTQ